MFTKAQLSNPTLLWSLFFATIVLTLSFQVASDYWGFTFIDRFAEPDTVRTLIASMTSEQRTIHALLTSTLDVAYPLSFGTFFAGSALAFFAKKGHWLALPGILVIGVDFSEGIVQVLALLNIVDWLELKAIITPTKNYLFIIGLFITVCGWISWLYAKMMAKPN